MIKRLLINLICFAYNWYCVYRIRIQQRIVTQRIQYVEQRKRYYK